MKGGHDPGLPPAVFLDPVCSSHLTLHLTQAEHYKTISPLVGGSIGQHLRHSIDHFAKLLGAVDKVCPSSTAD